MQVVVSRPGVLIVKPVGGLGNRIRVVASFELLARYTGRAFRVCWAPGAGFSDETLDELFDHEFDQADEAEFTRGSTDGLRLERSRAERRDARASMPSITTLRDVAAAPVVTYVGYHRLDRALQGVTDLPASFTADYLDAVRRWRPVESIRASVDLIAQHFDHSTIGVHIRRGDALVDPANLRRARRSTDAAFARRMDALLAANDGTTFFLATDAEETEAQFVDRYGDRIRTHSDKRFVPSHFTGPKDNQRDGVVDLFALARTSSILGSNASSFSRLAADIGGVPFERVATPQRLRLIRNKLVYEARRLRSGRRA